MSASFVIKKKYTASEHMEIMCVSRQCVATQENECFNGRMLHRKILCEIKKLESEKDRSIERGFPNSGCFWH